jgi:hypothetical protein
MGWLFAVSLGLQEGSARAVWRALGPLALGHALAIGAALLGAALLGVVVPLAWIKWIAAVALAGFGLMHLTRHWHPRYGGMRVGFRQLAIWSFLMASAHGAGLMVLPFVLGAPATQDGSAPQLSVASGPGSHIARAAFPGTDPFTVFAAGVHTVGYLVVTGLLAVLVYEKLGLRLLRTAWINLNLLWAIALLLTAVLTPLL